jgi:ABC-2 type transport system permease protein
VTIGAMIVRSLSRMRGVLIGVACLVTLFQVVLVLEARSYDQANMYELLGRMTPDFVQRWLGDSIATLASFRGMVAVGYFHPIIVLLVSMVAAYAASEPAGDAEAGYVDLLLSRPVPRRSLITRSAVVFLVCPPALALLMLAATWAAMAAFAPAARWPSLATMLTLAAHLVAVAWCFGALALAVASVVWRRGSALASAAIAAVSLYLTNVVAASWAPARIVDVVSPFHYYRATGILAGQTSPIHDLLVLGSASAALVALAYWRFSARDF